MQCLNCRTALASGAKFCSECGVPVPTAYFDGDTPAERRQLTVLFCDLVGSTALSARLDPEDLRNVIGAYHRCVADTVEPFDGFVARYMGDGALVYFGYPRAHEDNAERALRAALALVTKVAKFEVLSEHLSARIGIATGLVVVGELVNAGAAREQTALGETPNLAARLQVFAEPGTIVIADNTKRLGGSSFECRDLGAIPLRGFATPAQAWQVIGPARGKRPVEVLHPDVPRRVDPAARTGGTPLVGREQEFGLLGDIWRRVTQGQGRVVLLTGDAGIGKSRLAQALVLDVAGEPHLQIELRCSAYHTNSPLYPVIALFPTILGWRRDDSDVIRYAKLEAFCTEQQLSTTEALPLLAALLALPADARYPIPSMGPERQKQRTLQTLLRAVLALAVQQPVLVVVEDLHWIDPTTLELLTLLIGQVGSVKLFGIFTARLDWPAPWPAQPELTLLKLTRFSRQQTEKMIERLASGKDLHPDVIREIVAKTDGVPLFIEELTKMVIEANLNHPPDDRYGIAASAPPLSIPTTLQDSLTARLDRLADVKVVAQLGATLGREFSYAMLKAVSPLSDSALQHELGRLVEAQFLYQQGEPPDATYSFKHALIQEAAYQSLLKSTRQQYHERIARAMIEQFESEAGAHPEFVAMHFTEAGNLGAALQWWSKAGQHAFRRASFFEAIAHYTKGLRLLELLPQTQARDQIELGLRVEQGYALIPIKGWAAPETAQAFTRAGQLFDGAGESAKHFRALWGLGAFHFVRGDQHAARQVAQHCILVAQRADDLDALMEAYYLRGIVACMMGDFDAGAADLRQSIEHHGEAPRELHRVLYGQDAKASALGWLAMTQWVLGQPQDASRLAQEALAFVRDARQPFLLARGLAGVGFVDVFQERPQGPDSALATAIDLCHEQGFTYFHAVISAFQGTNLVNIGQIGEGIALMRTNITLLRGIGARMLFTVILGSLARAHHALAQIDEGLAAVAEGFECIERNGERWGESELHRVKAQLLLLRGPEHAGEAEASFVTALAIARAQKARSYELRAATSLAQFWLKQSRREESSALLVQTLSTWPEDLSTADLRAARKLMPLSAHMT